MVHNFFSIEKFNSPDLLKLYELRSEEDVLPWMHVRFSIVNRNLRLINLEQ